MRICLLAALSSVACVTKVEPFNCQTDSQCAGGICEPAGVCSASDPACASGRRYVPEAGDLAGVCVGEEPPDAPNPPDGGGTIDTPGPGACGDGVVNTGEDCDDMNEDEDDGCVSCVFARCGDGHVRAGAEECDDMNGNDDDGCTTGCLACTGGADTLGEAGHCYVRFDTATDWTSAYNACAALGGHLAIYETQAESMTVGAWLPAAEHWIGLSDLATEGTFHWDFLDLVDAQAHWAPTEPANQQNKDCVYQMGTAGEWTMDSCTTNYGYVCEREPWVVRPNSTHAYQLVALERRLAPWQDAHTDCTSRSTHLASISDGVEQDFLAGLAVATSWLGGQDMSTEDTFVWSTGEPFDAYTNWGPTQPDNAPGSEADCVALDVGGLWQDDPCNTPAAWICEVE
jgi:cysteine-rich repeat protein